MKFTGKFFQEKGIDFLEKVHIRIFGHEMSETMREFLGNLSWSFFGGIIAAGIMFVVNILAGRWLGPLGYGSYNYLLSFASSSMFIFLLGNNSSGVRYISDIKYKDEKNSILTASLVLSFAQAVIFLFAIILFKDLIFERYGIGNDIVYLIFIFGFVLSFKDLFDSFLRSLNLIKKQSYIKAVDAVLVFTSFIIFFYFIKKDFSYLFYVYSFLIGGTFFIACSFFLIRKNIAGFGWKHISLILHYNKFLILASIGGFIIGLDKVLIGRFIGTEALGIYSAYYTASQIVMINFVIMFMNIFLPATISNKHNIREIVGKINVIISKFFLLFVAVNFLSTYLVVLLFGEQYPLQFIWALLFALSSIFSVAFYIFLSLLNIDRIVRSIIISLVCYSLVIFSIVIFRDIVIYLIFQIVIYWIAIYYIQKILTGENKKVSNV